jgi:four helix bundle protein
MPITTYKDLEVYQLSFSLAMNIFQLSRKFPKEEIYSLTSQVVRSSRSVSANITEGWAKRTYENVFKQHLIDALGSLVETENWLLFAQACEYIDNETLKKYTQEIDVIGKKITKLHQNWKKH